MTDDQIEKRLKKHCEALNKLLSDVKKIYPKAEMYLDETGNLNMMSGPHHLDSTNSDCFGEKSNVEATIASAKLKVDSGGW